MRNVVITGGSRGIGAECVRCFSRSGFRVFFLYRNSDDEAHSLADETGAEAVRCDVSSAESVRKAAEYIRSVCSVDIVVNNAGISQIKMFQDITESDWDEMFDVNVKGMYLVSRAFLDDMVSRKCGAIVNISSMWGETGGSCEVHYSAAKAAVIGFTKALAKELGPSGITVNCVSPGVISTDMNADLSEETEAELIDRTPLMRIGTPSDVADAVMFLCSGKARFITGTVLPVNGGIVI